MTPSIPMPPEQDEDSALERVTQKALDAIHEHKPLKICVHCGGFAVMQDFVGQVFRFRVLCPEKSCGMRTPEVKTAALAAIIWNRRAPRKAIKMPSRRRAKKP